MTIIATHFFDNLGFAGVVSALAGSADSDGFAESDVFTASRIFAGSDYLACSDGFTCFDPFTGSNAFADLCCVGMSLLRVRRRKLFLIRGPIGVALLAE